MYISQTIHPPLSLLNGLMNEETMVAGMEVMRGLSNMDLHSPRLSAQSASSEINIKSLIWHHSSRCLANYLYCRLITLDHLHQGMGSILSYRNRCLSDIKLLCLHAMLLPKIPSVDVKNVFSTIIVFHEALLWIREPTSWQKK